VVSTQSTTRYGSYIFFFFFFLFHPPKGESVPATCVAIPETIIMG
jgi:hypothetical protein